MTKNEARQCAMDNYHIITRGCDRGLFGRDFAADAFEDALDLLLAPPLIAQSIRDAAINWPQYLGDVECSIVESFYDHHYGNGACCMLSALGHPSCPQYLQDKYLTFMLFVAEALK